LRLAEAGRAPHPSGAARASFPGDPAEDRTPQPGAEPRAPGCRTGRPPLSVV